MRERRLTLAEQQALVVAEVAAAVLITAAAAFIFINGAFFSSVSAPWVDFSINFTAAHAIRAGENPYGETALFERAEAMGMPTALIYRQLFTSYIQPPTSALSVLPLTWLGWPEGGRAYLLLNHAFLAGAVGLTLATVRPTLPWLWAAVVALAVVAFFNQVYASFALGQVDASITFLLALGLWGYRTGRPAATGASLAIGAAIKLLPALLLLYFLWRRQYRTFAWGAAVGLALLVASLPLAGIEVYRTYLTETVPALTKGSTFYSNISVVGAVTRPYVPGPLGGLDPLLSLEEVPFVAEARALAIAATLALLAAVALVIAARPPEATEARRTQAYVSEYYLVVAVALMISSVTWDFYVVWLLPFFVAAFTAPSHVLPRPPAQKLATFGLLLVAYLGLNYPGDFMLIHLFDVNSVFYHPEWVPGIWVEDRIDFYGRYLDRVPLLRLGSLSLVALTLAGIVLGKRLRGVAERAGDRKGVAAGAAATE